MIFNIVINIKKGSGGSDAGDFALEPSENFNLSFLRSYFADFVHFNGCSSGHFFSSDSNTSYIILKVF